MPPLHPSICGPVAVGTREPRMPASRVWPTLAVGEMPPTNSRSGGSSWLRWNIKFYFFAGRPPIRLATAAAERRLWVHAHQRRPGILPGGVRVGGVGYPWPLLARAGKQTFAFHLVVCTAVQHETRRRPAVRVASTTNDDSESDLSIDLQMCIPSPPGARHDGTRHQAPSAGPSPIARCPSSSPFPPIASPIVR